MLLTALPSQETLELRRQKANLRASAKITLAQTDRSAVVLQSEMMRKTLYTSLVWHTSRSVLIFAPIASEPDLLPVDFQEKDIYCLKSLNSSYEPVAVCSREDLQLGPRGIREPLSETPFPLEKIDLILVPGLAFDLKGGRLGRGGGHYDRILARPDCIGKIIGACFASQVVQEIPREEHDSSVTALLTESGLIEISSLS